LVFQVLEVRPPCLLAEELAAAGSDLAGARSRYEGKVKPAIEKKQRTGRRMAGWFVPPNPVRHVNNDLLTRMVEWPLAWRLLRRLMAPDSIIGSSPSSPKRRSRLGGGVRKT